MDENKLILIYPEHQQIIDGIKNILKIDGYSQNNKEIVIGHNHPAYQYFKISLKKGKKSVDDKEYLFISGFECNKFEGWRDEFEKVWAVLLQNSLVEYPSFSTFEPKYQEFLKKASSLIIFPKIYWRNNILSIREGLTQDKFNIEDDHGEIEEIKIQKLVFHYKISQNGLKSMTHIYHFLL